MSDLNNLKSKIRSYNDIRNNTIEYRKAWQENLKSFIIERLTYIMTETGLKGEIENKEDVTNLEAIMLSLGKEISGIGEIISEDATRPLIKHNGSLVYQQLFNGKVQVMLVYPYIEGYGEPTQPKVVGIYRPQELKEPFIIRHMEEFIREVVAWEDYDDDEPSSTPRIGFNINLDNQD